MFKPKAALAVLIPLVLAGCAREGDILPTGIIASYSACPPVAIPAGTGDLTLFNPPASRDAAAIDVVATITNVRSTCDESGEYIVSNATFEVQAQRRDATGAREVVVPYFATVVHGGTNVVSKRVSRVALNFADGSHSATARGAATAQVLRSAATLPEDVRRQITRQRRPGDPDAAIDPLADPTVRAAVQRATFELLVGFNLTEEQLRYNATR
ncbi:MAG: hypothetical protein ACK4K7_05590 [Allosphingosinicella sp.]|uniref:hypothetical protein n=1 Tax=Allosphingosinicella sp. TaxID=2823234 RepID=UPI00392A8465